VIKLSPKSALVAAVAFFGGAVGWLALQQGEGAIVYVACPVSGPPLGVVLGLLATLLCLGASALGWRVAQTALTPALRLIGQVGLGAGAVFALGCAVITLAIWLEPACAR
jgi:hypothetical protein